MKVLLLIVDSLRADGVGFGGGPSSPTMDALAGQGACFHRAFCSGSWTVPSVLSMVTGRLPSRLGVCRWRHPLPFNAPALPAAFAQAGFEVRIFGPSPRWFLSNVPGVGLVGSSQDPAGVEQGLRAPRGVDQLIVVHHWWTHLPYLQRSLDKPAWRRVCDSSLQALAELPQVVAPKLRDLQAHAVAHFDRELLPRYLDAAASGGDDLLVMITADHGENWGEALPAGRRVEHIFDLHGRWMTDATTRVPLLVHGASAAGRVLPGTPAGFARGVDVAPTLLELAGLPVPLDLDGRSLVPSVLGGRPTGLQSAITVATHNVDNPDHYPQSGPVAFPRYAVRRPGSRLVVDFIAGTQEATPLDGATHAPPAGRDEEALAALWRQARDAGPLRPREGALESAGPPATDDKAPEPESLADRFRMLGYSE